MDRVDLVLAAGERVAILGPNGAGKTTLLRLVATLLRPDSGRLAIEGKELPSGADHARRSIGYLGHQPLVYLDLSAWENLDFFAALYDVADARQRIGDALQHVGLLARAYDPVRTFSRGMAQRLGLARMMLHDPTLLLLDEPHVGLDARGVELLDELLVSATGRSTILVTHDLDRAMALSDRVVAMRAGRVAFSERTADLSPAALAERYREVLS